jgi:hypothetical protein
LRADGGADAIGADHGIGLDFVSIGEACKRDAVAGFCAGAILAEMNNTFGQRFVKDALQVGAMGGEIGRAVFGLGHAAEWDTGA